MLCVSLCHFIGKVLEHYLYVLSLRPSNIPSFTQTRFLFPSFIQTSLHPVTNLTCLTLLLPFHTCHDLEALVFPHLSGSRSLSCKRRRRAFYHLPPETFLSNFWLQRQCTLLLLSPFAGTLCFLNVFSKVWPSVLFWSLFTLTFHSFKTFYIVKLRYYSISNPNSAAPNNGPLDITVWLLNQNLKLTCPKMNC